MKLRTLLSVIVLVTLLGNTLHAQQYTMPKVTISGNDGPVEYGEMALITARYDDSSLPPGLVSIKFNWAVIDDGRPKKFFVTDTEKEIAFAVGLKARKILVILDVNFVFADKETVFVSDKDGKNPTPRQVMTNFVVMSPTPIMSEVVVGGLPTPPPTPTPTPSFPIGTFGLAQFAYDTFKADANLTTEVKALLAAKLADNLEGIASKINAISTYSDVSTILADTRNGNDAAFKSIDGFDPAKAETLKVALRQKMSKLYQDKKLNSASDIAVAWRELSMGLRGVK